MDTAVTDWGQAMRVLVVEDEAKLLDALVHILKKQGYAVDMASDGEGCLELASSGVYDIIILDRMLPCLDGISVVKELRQLGVDSPVLFLTAKDTVTDRVEGLDAGADDYLVKPFSTDELLARVRALSRRKGKDLVSTVLISGELQFEPLSGQVLKKQEIIQLTVKEALLLELLMRNQGKVLTKDRILEKVWGYNSDTELSNVDLYIYYLRKKLGSTTIKTIRGVGYCLQGA